MKNPIRRYIQLRPHADRLLTSSASFWLLSARTLIFLIAFTEAMSWGYLGTLFGQGPERFLVGAVAGLTVFLLVWVIDVSLVTMDRAWSEHSVTVLGHAKSSSRGLKDLASFGLRIALLLASISITAPYLSLLVFHRDVDQSLDKQATAELDRGRQALQSGQLAELNHRRELRDAKQRSYEAEVAGKGESGRYGNGPAAQALAVAVAQLDQDIREREQRHQASLSAFDRLAADWAENRDQLASLYNLALPQSTLFDRQHALTKLLELPENRSVQLAIKVYLGFLFTALLLLKLFELSSVRLYFSEILQQEFLRYEVGVYDSQLPLIEGSSNAGRMSPQRFYGFLMSVAEEGRRAERADAADRGKAAIRENLDVIERIRKSTEEQRTRRHAAVKELLAELDDVNRSTKELQTATAAVAEDIAYFSKELSKIEELENGDHVRGARPQLLARERVATRLQEAIRAHRRLEEVTPGEAERKARLEADLARAQAALAQSEAELREKEALLQGLHGVVASKAGERVRHASVH